MSGDAFVLGVSADERAVARAVEDLHRAGYHGVETFSPVPIETGTAPQETSPVRFYTLAGAAVGLVAGLALTIGTSLAWPMMTGGKPIVSIPPFLVITFEVTVLCAGLFTVAGLLIHAGQLRSPSKSAHAAAYDTSFSTDRFGIVVPCSAEQIEAVKRLVIAAGLSPGDVHAKEIESKKVKSEAAHDA